MVQERRLGTLVEPLVHAEVIWNPAWSGHTGPALYSCTDTGGVMGVFFFFLQCPFEGCSNGLLIY